ncbi:TPA: BppU family phage baseplate upper protein [Enterococcus faecium]
MASSLYNLALDFSKELNYTKAIMARQGDKGITVTVKPFLNGLQMDTSGGTFTLKGTTPSNRYVDSVATSVTSEEVTFSLDGTFMSEAGYYKHCYVEYRKDDQILTTQDIIFFSLGVSDISQGQADEYVSQLEELIRKYNETFDAFLAEIKGRMDSLNKQITDLTGQAKTLQDKLDALKEEISKLGNLHVMYSNSIEFGGYDYSGNPNIAPNVGFNDFYNNGSQTGYTAKDGVDHIAVTRTADAPPAGKLLNLRTLLPNKTYSLSVDIWADMEVPSGAISCNIRLREGTEVRSVWALINKPVGTNRTTYSVTFTTAANFVTTEESRVSLWFNDSAGACTGYLGYNIKIEEGPTATPYQPNLLDAPYYLSKIPLGENILKPASFPINTTEYMAANFTPNEPYVQGQKYTFIMKASKPSTQTFGIYLRAGSLPVGNMVPVEGLADVWQLTFEITQSHIDGSANALNVFQAPQSTKGTVNIEWAKLEKGDTRTPNIEQYKYRGIGMRDSNNPKDYVWDLAPEYVEDNLATDVKISEITGKANNYTDGKVSEINSQLTASIHAVDTTAKDAQTKANANATAIKNTNNRVDEIENKMPLYAIYGEGANLSKVSSGTKIPIGALIAMDFAHTSSDLPYTIGSDRNTLTATRDCVLFFEGSVKLHGDNTLKYAYVKIRKNGSDTNFTNLGSSVNFNYMTTQAGQYVHTLVTGDKVEFTIETAAGGIMFATQLLSLKISEVKPV